MLLEAQAACLLIVSDRARFPELGGGPGHPQWRKFTASGRARDRRRLEAIALVWQSILGHTDLVRNRSGRTRRDGSCDAIPNRRWRKIKGRREPHGNPRKQTTIQDEAGTSGEAVDRALRDLRSAGYVTSSQPIKRWTDETGNVRWRALPAIHVITEAGWARLGISAERLSVERTKASDRERAAPVPVVDILLSRARQRIVRAQQRTTRRQSYQPTEAQAAEAIRQLERIRIMRRTE